VFFYSDVYVCIYVLLLVVVLVLCFAAYSTHCAVALCFVGRDDFMNLRSMNRAPTSLI